MGSGRFVCRVPVNSQSDLSCPTSPTAGDMGHPRSWLISFPKTWATRLFSLFRLDFIKMIDYPCSQMLIKVAPQLRNQTSLFAALLVASSLLYAQESASVDVPITAKAGELVEITITLDRAPNFDGGCVQVWVSGQGGYEMQSSTAEIRAGVKSAPYSFKLPLDAVGGTWFIQKLAFYSGSKQIQLGFTPVSFKVIPTQGLIYPGSAEVSLNPSQVQLLRQQASSNSNPTVDLGSKDASCLQLTRH